MSNLPVYLVDYSMFNPPEELRVDFYRSQDDAWKWKVRSSKWALMQCCSTVAVADCFRHFECLSSQ
jgi:hypothetical protein